MGLLLWNRAEVNTHFNSERGFLFTQGSIIALGAMLAKRRLAHERLQIVKSEARALQCRGKRRAGAGVSAGAS